MTTQIRLTLARARGRQQDMRSPAAIGRIVDAMRETFAQAREAGEPDFELADYALEWERECEAEQHRRALMPA